MCSCKKTQCVTSRCSCVKAGKKCSSSCSCENCKNTDKVAVVKSQPVVESSQKEEVGCIENHPFELPLVVYSWNMCNFCAIYESFANKEKKDNGITRKWTDDECRQLILDTRKAFEYLARNVDILVLQEFRFNMEQIKLIISWMSPDIFSHAVSTAEDKLEYVYIWRNARVQPLKPMVDEHVHTLISNKMKRPVGSMRFIDLEYNIPIVCTTFHIKSGGGSETVEDIKSMMDQFDSAFQRRYGASQEGIQILVGDLNLNPHLNENVKKMFNKWAVLGTANTVTSSGGNGYDFFMVRSVGCTISATNQMCLPLRRAKNSALSKIGISDHFPIFIYLTLT